MSASVIRVKYPYLCRPTLSAVVHFLIKQPDVWLVNNLLFLLKCQVGLQRVDCLVCDIVSRAFNMDILHLMLPFFIESIMRSMQRNSHRRC